MMAPTMLAISTGLAILALIGLVIGLVVLFVVIFLLNDVLTPLRRILHDVQDAQTAPLLEHGVKGADQLERTRRLAEAVPDLAVRYMQKLGLPVNTDAPAQTFPEPGPTRGGWL